MKSLQAKHWAAISLSVFLILLVFVWGGNDIKKEVTASEPSSASSTALPPANAVAPVPSTVQPFTGLPLVDGVDLPPKPLLMKIGNHPKSRPQSGLDMADIVFELRAESITRFIAVFHSQLPEKVGPVRSARTSDLDIIEGFGSPLFGYSGSNVIVKRRLDSTEAQLFSEENSQLFFRDASRSRPYNLYVNPDHLLEKAQGAEIKPWFTYKKANTSIDLQEPPSPVKVDFTDAPTVVFTWDESLKGWTRTQNGKPHISNNDELLAPKNVVIMITTYQQSTADSLSPELVSTGGGAAVVLSEGAVRNGTWSRPTKKDAVVLKDISGEVLELAPGQTWVVYPEAGQVSFGE